MSDRATNTYSFKNSVPIFGTGLIGKQLAFAFGVPFLVVFGGMSIWSMIDSDRAGRPLFSGLDGFQYAAVLIGITVVLTFLVIYAMNRNRYLVRYEISEEGIYETYQEEQLRKNRKVNLIGMLALFLGKPGVAGSAMLAHARQESLNTWEEIDSFREDRDKHTIAYRCGLVHNAVFCTTENYDDVLALFVEFAGEAKRK